MRYLPPMPERDPPPLEGYHHGSVGVLIARLEAAIRERDARIRELEGEVLRLGAFCTAGERMGAE